MSYAYRTASTDRYGLLKAFARENRQHPTEAESLLWNHLRQNDWGLRFKRQHIIGDYIADFVCLEQSLVIEVDGSYHSEAEQVEHDEMRSIVLQRMGFRVMRFTNKEVFGALDEVLNRIQKELNIKTMTDKQTTHSPQQGIGANSPSPRGGQEGALGLQLPPLGEGPGRGLLRVGILGAAGYTGGELIRLLTNHPQAEIVFANSGSNAGNRVCDVHGGLVGETELRFTDQMPFDEVDVVFFCFGHGKSEEFLREHSIPQRVKVIDLAQDFRVRRPDGSTDDWVYGLPELHRDEIRHATRLANPGCFATCIQLALLPALKAGLFGGDIHVNGITGSTGAGQKPTATTHYSWRQDNISVYKAFEHQHLLEINQTVQELSPGYDGRVLFVPQRGCFTRGIFVTAYATCPDNVSAEDAARVYADFYADAAFTHYVAAAPDLKQVVNTNKALVSTERHGDQLLVTCCIDNLLKGAVGQAVQNMNLMCGLDEREGLRLKASAF